MALSWTNLHNLAWRLTVTFRLRPFRPISSTRRKATSRSSTSSQPCSTCTTTPPKQLSELELRFKTLMATSQMHHSRVTWTNLLKTSRRNLPNWLERPSTKLSPWKKSKTTKLNNGVQWPVTMESHSTFRVLTIWILTITRRDPVLPRCSRRTSSTGRTPRRKWPPPTLARTLVPFPKKICRRIGLKPLTGWPLRITHSSRPWLLQCKTL
jgi:hypothetical protein